ncbi:MAG: tRNA (adenosine(37)-N6)-threonylcarbamoyltransferase complex dimerization subunit type 1 TsaB [Actinomycetota bacterium]
MTTILAIDTSTDRTSVGLINDGQLLLEFHHDDPLAHGEILPKLVEKLLATGESIDQVAIGMGPGPFTGLRVGIAFGQAFALAREIPWIGVSSLAAMAYVHKESEFIVAIDARRREFFCQHYVEGKLFAPTRTLQREELAKFTLPTFYDPPTPLAIAQLSREEFSVTEPIYIRKPDARVAPKGVKFRPWTQIDLVDIYALEKTVYLIDPWSFTQFKEEYAGVSRQYLVAEFDGKIVGYAGVMVAGDVTDILTLTVAPEFRRRGIARELLKRMIDWSRNQKVEGMMLEMREGNLEAEPLYLAHGFRELAKRADYYGPGITAVVMRKELHS